MKDWNGNQNSIYKTLGASNHTEKERQPDDYYATEPKARNFYLNKRNSTIQFGNVLVVKVILQRSLKHTDTK